MGELTCYEYGLIPTQRYFGCPGVFSHTEKRVEFFCAFVLTTEVEHDLVDLFEYIAGKDSMQSAYSVLDSLDQQPERGNYPVELVERGIREYRELHYKPYRLIYEIIGKPVVILACLGGRRDMQLLLERRLFR